MVVHDLACSSCKYEWDDMVDPDKLPECPECGDTTTHIIYRRAPAQMNRTLPDGYRARNDDTWLRGKIVTDLQIERANIPHNKRSDIDREIAKVNKGGIK